MRLLFVQVCCSMTSDYEICWTFIAVVCSTISSVQKSPHLRLKENSVISAPGLFCGLAREPLKRLHPLKLVKLKAEGHGQRLFIEATFMCRLAADIFNIRPRAPSETLQRATCELCRVIPPLTAMEMWRERERACTVTGNRPVLSCHSMCSSWRETSLFDTHAVTLLGIMFCMICCQQVPILK